jgi:hypothetical protein
MFVSFTSFCLKSHILLSSQETSECCTGAFWFSNLQAGRCTSMLFMLRIKIESIMPHHISHLCCFLMFFHNLKSSMNNRIAKFFLTYIARHKTYVSWCELENSRVRSCTFHGRLTIQFSPNCVPARSQSSKMSINQNCVCVYVCMYLSTIGGNQTNLLQENCSKFDVYPLQDKCRKHDILHVWEQYKKCNMSPCTK